MMTENLAGRVWWCTSLIPVSGRQTELYEFGASLVYITGFQAAKATHTVRLCLNKNKTKQSLGMTQQVIAKIRVPSSGRSLVF